MLQNQEIFLQYIFNLTIGVNVSPFSLVGFQINIKTVLKGSGQQRSFSFLQLGDFWEKTHKK